MTKIKKLQHLALILIFTGLAFQLHPPNLPISLPELINDGKIHLSAQDQWLKNSDFSSQQQWFYSKGSQGENSSVDADISEGKANYYILGEERIFKLSGVPNSTESPGWYEFAKPDYYLPDTTLIDSSGCYVSHSWNERSNQFPGVHWRKNITIPEDMSKYKITSANLDVIFNASVIGLGNDAAGGVDVLGESAANQFGIGDFVTFYVLISDTNFINPYIVALNRTIDLGVDSDGATSLINNSLIFSYGESVIITALNSAFEKDTTHSNFTLTLGIDIYSEDNWGNDRDTFTYLRINNCNLTFTYERIVEKFTSISWNQIGSKISGNNVQITDALLYFNYTINETWPFGLSPFSEMRVLINNNPFKDTIQLSSAKLYSQQVIFEGIDFTSLFIEDVNISIAIQIFIGNTFGLNREIIISIDDVFLIITYKRVTPGVDLSILVIGLTIGIIGLVVGSSLYQFHFKFPPLVRKIRKLKKSVKKGRKTKPILVINREEIFKKEYDNYKKILNLEIVQPRKLEKINKIEKIVIEKEEDI